MRIAIKIFLLLLVYLLIFQSCKKFDCHNPYDPECPKSLFTPNSLKGEMIGNTIKLTWLQENESISGFEVYRSSVTEEVINLLKLKGKKLNTLIVLYHPVNNIVITFWLMLGLIKAIRLRLILLHSSLHLLLLGLFQI